MIQEILLEIFQLIKLAIERSEAVVWRQSFVIGSLRSSHPEVFLGKGLLKICSKFTEHSCQSAISIKLQSNFIEIALRHRCCPVN